MSDTEKKTYGSTCQRLLSSFGASSSSLPSQNQNQNQNTEQIQLFALNQSDTPDLQMPLFRGQIRQLSPNIGIENRMSSTPPISPYSQSPVIRPSNQQLGLQSFISSPAAVRMNSIPLSQPPFFAADSLPPLIPCQYRESANVSMEERDGCSNSIFPSSHFTRCSSSKVSESLPPRKSHRRSNSDIPFGFSAIMQSPSPLIPSKSSGSIDRPVFTKEYSEAHPVQLVKRDSSWEKSRDMSGEGTGERKSEGEVVDDLFSAYMNLDNIDAFNSSGTDDKLGNENREDLDSRASGTKTNDSSDNEATSVADESWSMMQRQGLPTFPGKREGIKRNARGDVTQNTRHQRSVSMDSFMGKINFGDESPQLPPSPGTQPTQLSRATSLESNENAFCLEFSNGEFSNAELKKIMTNEKLAEIACSDPKRVKRILANRQSAARSKERKMRYITELEHKVQTLQTEATSLSAQLTLLQRDSAGLTNQNNELKFRLQSMEQQAQLRDALNESLRGEVQRLKLVTTEKIGDPSKFQQLSINPQMYHQLHHQQQQATQLHMHHLQQQPQQQQQQQQRQPRQLNDCKTAAKHEPDH